MPQQASISQNPSHFLNGLLRKQVCADRNPPTDERRIWPVHEHLDMSNRIPASMKARNILDAALVAGLLDAHRVFIDTLPKFRILFCFDSIKAATSKDSVLTLSISLIRNVSKLAGSFSVSLHSFSASRSNKHTLISTDFYFFEPLQCYWIA